MTDREVSLLSAIGHPASAAVKLLICGRYRCGIIVLFELSSFGSFCQLDQPPVAVVLPQFYGKAHLLAGIETWDPVCGDDRSLAPQIHLGVRFALQRVKAAKIMDGNGIAVPQIIDNDFTKIIDQLNGVLLCVAIPFTKLLDQILSLNIHSLDSPFRLFDLHIGKIALLGNANIAVLKIHTDLFIGINISVDFAHIG